MKDIEKEFEEFNPEEESIKSEFDSFLSEDIPKEPTFEEQYLQPIYDVASPVLKGLSVLGKPLSLAGAAGRSAGKLISGQEDASSPLMAELGTIFPTQEGNPLAGLETIEGMGDPLIQSPEFLKEDAPKLASFVEQSFTPANIAQELLDKGISIAGSSAYKKSAEDLAPKTKNMAKNLIDEPLARMGGNQFIQELEDTGKLNFVKEKIVTDKNILKNINNPEKVIRYLTGDKIGVDLPGGKRSVQVIREGKMADVGKRLKEEIQKSLPNKTIDMEDDLVKPVLEKLKADFDKRGSGETFSEQKVRNVIEEFTKTNPYMEGPKKTIVKKEMSPVGGIKSVSILNNQEILNAKKQLEKTMEKNQATFKDLVDVKRGAADKIYELGDVRAAKDSFKEKVINELWSQSDKIIESAGVPEVLKLNNEYSDYANIRNIVGNKNIDQRAKVKILNDIIAGVAVGVPVGVATGSPWTGLLAGGGFSTFRSMDSGLGEKIPGMTANVMQNYVQPIAEKTIGPATVMGSMSPESQPQPSRQPQSISDFIPRGIPLQDPMMKAHAIDAIGRDKQNTPARNAERMMKIINEGIFED